jgi:hypothetical protein
MKHYAPVLTAFPRARNFLPECNRRNGIAKYGPTVADVNTDFNYCQEIS